MDINLHYFKITVQMVTQSVQIQEFQWT